MPAIWYENGLHCIQLSADCPYDVVGFSFARCAGCGQRAQFPHRVGRDECRTRCTRSLHASRSIQKMIRNTEDRMARLSRWRLSRRRSNLGIKTPPKNVRVRVTHSGTISHERPTHEKNVDKPLALRMDGSTDNNDIPRLGAGAGPRSEWQGLPWAHTLRGLCHTQNFVYADVGRQYRLPEHRGSSRSR